MWTQGDSSDPGLGWKDGGSQDTEHSGSVSLERAMS